MQRKKRKTTTIVQCNVFVVKCECYVNCEYVIVVPNVNERK